MKRGSDNKIVGIKSVELKVIIQNIQIYDKRIWKILYWKKSFLLIFFLSKFLSFL